MKQEYYIDVERKGRVSLTYRICNLDDALATFVRVKLHTRSDMACIGRIYSDTKEHYFLIKGGNGSVELNLRRNDPDREKISDTARLMGGTVKETKFDSWCEKIADKFFLRETVW